MYPAIRGCTFSRANDAASRDEGVPGSKARRSRVSPVLPARRSIPTNMAGRLTGLLCCVLPLVRELRRPWTWTGRTGSTGAPLNGLVGRPVERRRKARGMFYPVTEALKVERDRCRYAAGVVSDTGGLRSDERRYASGPVLAVYTSYRQTSPSNM